MCVREGTSVCVCVCVCEGERETVKAAEVDSLSWATVQSGELSSTEATWRHGRV